MDPTNLLKTLNHYPKRALGQNFLRDPAMVAALLESAQFQMDQPVFEIGPGLGAMTRPLIDAGFRLTALERDAVLFRYLENEFSGKASFVLGDALTADFGTLLAGQGEVQVLSNLPYSVGTEILFRLVEQSSLFPKIVVMVQREVATRLRAKAGEDAYGRLSILPQNYYDIQFLKRLSGHCFVPEAEVESDFIGLTRRLRPLVDLSDLPVAKAFDHLVRAAFQYRRKTFANAVKISGQFLPDRAAQAFQQLRLDPKRRGETLDITEFFALAEILAKA